MHQTRGLRATATLSGLGINEVLLCSYFATSPGVLLLSMFVDLSKRSSFIQTFRGLISFGRDYRSPGTKVDGAHPQYQHLNRLKIELIETPLAL
jgi:hypothetical protein